MAEPLPGMPEPPAPKPHQAKPGLKATRIGTTRLCERCCELIHRMGVWAAPYPRVARWRVDDGSSVTRLCWTHKEERCG